MMDVIYSNAQPKFKEFGPFVYKESDTYANLTYTEDLKFNGASLHGVNATFSQNITFDSDASGNIDTELYLTN